MKTIAVLQSNYIPWKGYFDMIAAVDEFILYDDVQFTRRDWRNRNQIKTPHGVKWLTVPVKVKGKYNQKIKDTQIAGSDWTRAHWNSLLGSYSQSSHFNEIAEWLAPLYLDSTYTHISEVNRQFVDAVCDYLDINTRISCSSDYTLSEGKTERIVDLCKQVGGAEYVSGPAAKNYLSEDIFIEQGIKLNWFDYGDYQEYPQLWGEFTHSVTVLDLLFNCGGEARQYMKF